MPIRRRISYALKCDSKVQTLQDEVDQLTAKRISLQQSVDTRSAQDINPNVTEWLCNADSAIGEAEQLAQSKEVSMKKCFVGICPNFKTRYQLSKNVELKTAEIQKLLNKQGLDPISTRPLLQPITQPPSGNGQPLSSRVSILNQVMDALKDPNLNMIGVYGMGGIGKTTLAFEVQAKATQEKLFDTVIVVPVSQAPELRRIQGLIADFLGLKFDAEEIPGRASQLLKRLENSNVLIILDDLWKKLDLFAVGIPSQKETSNGRCKIMLTSRRMDLLSREMGAQSLFALESLDEIETFGLFMSAAEPSHDLLTIATEIAKKCAGLPLLIQIVAAGLKNKESHVWKDTLNQLSTHDSEDLYDKVYKVIESSFENLLGKEIKSFFLLCALFGQSNIGIQYLLIYSMGLGLFKHIRTVEDARDRVFSLIEKLKDSSLLMDGDIVGFVKMHDVVRDTARNIASRSEHQSFIGNGEVRSRDWPKKDCTRISFPFCDMSEIPLRMDCPEAELFLLFTEDLLLEIPDSFFDGNMKLKVVDFTGMRMVRLPSSISLLASLQALCLQKCRLNNVALLGELKQLELLSFAESKIVELPREIEVLTRLKLLDLRDCSSLRVIPEGLLSKLCSLEELYILNSFGGWGSKGNVSLMELESLSQLFTLEIEIVNPEMIPIGFKWFSQLRRYKISIGEWDWQGQYKRSRTLKLKVGAGGDFEDGTKSLLRETEDLYLDGMTGIESVFYDGSPKLKHLQVENDFGVQHLIKSTMQASFPELESLFLKRLQKMENFCSGQLGLGSFGKLHILNVMSCDKLKSLFSFSSAKCLLQLRELKVENCENMEAVFGEGSEAEYHNNEVIEFTQLSSLKLKNLPHLTGFCEIKEGTEHMRLLFNKMVCFPNLTRLWVDGCNSLKHIFTVSMVKCLMRLKKLEIRNCELVEEIIESKKMEEIEEEDSTRTIVFPELHSLKLDRLPNLKRLSSFVGKVPGNESEESLFNEMVTFPNLESLYIHDIESIKHLWDEQFIADDSFSKLKSIYISNCSKLSIVFPSKICARFQRVESLRVIRCERVEEIYQSNANYKETQNAFSLRHVELDDLPSLKHIWNKDKEWGAFSPFQNLQSVYVSFCKNLKYVFPASVGCGLLQLQRLYLKGCNQLEVMIAREKDDETSAPSFQFPELTELTLVDLKEMRSFYEGGPHSFHCPKLKILFGCSDISIEKFICNLEEMRLDYQSFHAIHRITDFSAELCTKLKKVTLLSFNEGASIDIVFGFLSRIRSLELLVLWDSSFEEIFSQRPIEDGQHHCLRLKHMKLVCIKMLKHVTKTDFQHLQTLYITLCHDLISIAPSSTSLHNLTTLHLEHCNNLTYLVTTSTAKTMGQLIEMKVEKCRRIEEIVAKDADGTEHGEIIFNKLQYLVLTSLPNFNSFSSEKHTFGFPLLEKVTIKGCSRMKIFCNRVIRTPKLRGIVFEGEQHWDGNINDTISSQLREWVGDHLEEERLFPNLETLQLAYNMFSSKAISANQMHFLNKLRNIKVRDCNSIEVIFDLQSDVGFLLPKLNELELINLPMLKQLCNRAPNGILDFYKLKVLNLEKCDRLVYAFTCSMASCLSQLETIQVKNCEMMETLIVDEEDNAARIIFSSLEYVVLEDMPKFSTIYSGRGDLECPSLYEITLMECPIIKASFFFIFPSLKKLSTDIETIRGMMQFGAPSYCFSFLQILKVFHCNATTTSHTSLVRFLSRLPNLDQLKLCDSSFKELLNSNSEEAPTMPPIQSLRLENLDDLNKISWHAFSRASFQNLATLEVYNCNQLMNLNITPTLVRNMVQLKELRVSFCKMLNEIVGDASDHASYEIVFTNLETLQLNGLLSLQAFSLTHHHFKFPCLKNVILRCCPNMRVFCHGILETPKLNCVKDWSYSNKLYWEGDLNTTTITFYQEMGSFVGVEEIKLSIFPVLKEKWDSQFHIRLSNLRRLEVDNCEQFTNAIPSHILHHLESLEILIIEKCYLLEQVFALEGLNANEYGINRMRNLEELQLIDLSRLKQVWSKDPQQILGFKYLQILKVHNCDNLTFIFNLSMALSLQNLQYLEVKSCSLVEHIIVIAEEETMHKYKTVFPSLKSMTLLHLTHLLSFCSTSGVVECPSLKIVEAVDCPNLELFSSTFSEGQDSSITVEDPDSLTAFLGNKMVVPGLEELKVEWKTLKDELIGNYQSAFFSRLKCIELACFQGEEYTSFPPAFLEQFLKLEKLALDDALIEEINLDDLGILKNKDPESIALLTKLKLSKLPNLKHLVRHDCLSIPLFKNLTDLELLKCDGLINLISASVAKSLVQLRRMSVKDCKMMREIVADASDGEEYEIRLSQLQYLELDGLQCITCFSSGNHSFYFPSLQEVVIIECPNMRNFVDRVSVNTKLRKIKTGRHKYDWEWEGSLSDTIQAVYKENVAKGKAAQNTSAESDRMNSFIG